MVNPGLSRRLDQHGRRAGIAIGLTMVVVTLLLIGAFVTIYGRLDPMLSDFVAADVPTVPPPTLQATVATDPNVAAAAATQAPSATQPAAVTATSASAATNVTPTATGGAFEPDYRIASSGEPINFRSSPSLNNEAITSLQPGTPLEFLGEERDDADNFADNGTWLRFKLDDGTEGWVREIDVEQTNG